ncbi:MAG TPA: hypothetical protein DC024_03985 [Clostridiales bacterium]|nr:hypothetical protein [Clostridiales bacterium]
MKNAISTSMAPKAIGPYSQAILSNGTLYISGQLPIDALNGAFPGEDVTSQTNQAIKNLASILESDMLPPYRTLKNNKFYMGVFICPDQ